MTRLQISDEHVPEEWVRTAEEQDISLAEFARRMINAGMRQFGYDYDPKKCPTEKHTLQTNETGTSSTIDTELKQWIYTNLSTDEGEDVEDLIQLLEEDLLELADELCDEGRAKYRRSKGGYIKQTDE